MKKRLYFVETNAFYMIVSVDRKKNCRYLIENTKCEFPHLWQIDKDERWRVAVEFLKTVEDNSSWRDNLTYDELFDEEHMWSYTNPDGAVIIAEFEKEL